ncbi:MAG: pyridoxal-phosphate dependent enzyme, partial [Candidatus Micrarchaeota archaeon]|nr:pyridoxal-phosphate dependent enzyme [Candidatus Micrarchaeota archaeon]
MAALPESSRQIGLRNRAGQGSSKLFKEVESTVEIVEVPDAEAYEWMKRLWEQGIPGGPSSGTNLAAASKIGENPVVTLVPDSRWNYPPEFLEKIERE